MSVGKTLFAQVMDFLPWKTFHRIVNRYGGDYRTRSLSCTEQFRVMAFAQLTYRESLRDIEVCLAAQAGKLYHMGIGAAVARSTLADANESRDWRIYFELAQRLIIKARALYVDEDFGVELANTVYALDATTIDLCLSMFPWAPFRSTKAAVKLHTLLDLRGSIPPSSTSPTANKLLRASSRPQTTPHFIASGRGRSDTTKEKGSVHAFAGRRPETGSALPGQAMSPITGSSSPCGSSSWACKGKRRSGSHPRRCRILSRPWLPAPDWQARRQRRR
jgi:hypothetical protein